MTISLQPLRVSDLDERDRDCLRALFETAGDYDDQRLRHCVPVHDTGTWLTENESDFMDWEANTTSDFIWLTAHPACGKSVFANGYLKKVQEERPAIFVCSYFFKKNGAHQALSAILHQILTKYPGAASYTREEFAAKGSSFALSTRTLWKMIYDICKKAIPVGTEVMLVLDGLDECDEPSRSTLIEEMLSTLTEDDKAGPPFFKALVTSRPTSDIELAFRPFDVTRIKGEDKETLLHAEINRVIDYRIGQLGSKKLLKKKHARLLRSELQCITNGSFLYVDAIFKLLAERGRYNESGIESAIEDAKQELNCLYEHALSTMPSQALDLFQCLLAMSVKPSLGMLNVALALRAKPTRIMDPTITEIELELEPDIEYTVRRLGGFLVRVSNGRVDFIHGTARDFLLGWTGHGDDIWDETTCHFTMADRCVRFLAGTRDCKISGSVASQLKEPPFEDFYTYATRKWYFHAWEGGVGHEIDTPRYNEPEYQRLRQSIGVLCDPSRDFLASWWPHFATKGDESKEKRLGAFTRKGSAWYFKDHREYLLHRAASVGDPVILNDLLTSAQLSITDKNEEDEDVLCVAAREGHQNTVSWILRNFADAPLQREAALAMALRRGVKDTALTLLRREHAPLDTWSLRWPAAYSTQNLSPEAMELLSRNISFACLWGRFELLTKLIQGGADVNAKSGGMSPLVAAVFLGQLPLVRSLLDRGADPDELSFPDVGSLDPDDWNALEDLDKWDGSLSQGNIDMVWRHTWRYLKAGALGITPLAVAAQSGQLGIADLLRKRGSMESTVTLAVRRALPNCGVDTNPSTRVCEVTSRNIYSLKNSDALGQKICHEIVSEGPVEVLEELITYGCLELPPDGRKWTLLHVAAASGNIESIEVLLREGSRDMRWSKDACQLTCLRVALRSGHGNAALRIHKADSELARETVEGRTMLQDAVYGEIMTGTKVIEDVLSLIVDKAQPIEETVDSRDDQGRTALHHVIVATQNWEPASADAKCYAANAVRALIIGGAEYNIVDDEDLTPLAFASQAVAQAESANPPVDARVYVALMELETTLRRVPFWGDNRLDAGAIRGNYEELLRNKGEKMDIDESNDWMLESEDELYEDDGDEEIEYDE